MISPTMPDAHPPFFIVGAARSGTTLLRLMLNAHPQLHIGGESHFIPHLWQRRDAFLHAGRITKMDVFISLLTGHENFEAFAHTSNAEAIVGRLRALPVPPFPEAIDAIFRVGAEAHRKKRWGDKTPRHLEHMGLLGQIFPEALFIHIIRDARDVALSRVEDALKRQRLYNTPLRFPARPKVIAGEEISMGKVINAEIVRTSMEKGRKQRALIPHEKYLAVKFEELVADPAKALLDICAFLGEKFDASMFRYYETAMDQIHSEAQYAHTFAAEGPRAERTQRWRTNYGPMELYLVERITGSILSEYGYPLASNLPWRKRIRAHGVLLTRMGAAEYASPWLKRLRKVVGRIIKGLAPGWAPRGRG